MVVTKLFLRISVGFLLTFSSLAAFADDVNSAQRYLVGATELYLANGSEIRAHTLVEALHEDSRFPTNLEIILKTIVEAPVLETTKISRLRELQRHVESYAERYNDSVNGAWKTTLWIGGAIGALIWIIVAPNCAVPDELSYFIVPFLGPIIHAVQGGAVGSIAGGVTLGFPLQLRLRKNKIQTRSLELLQNTCDMALANRRTHRIER